LKVGACCSELRMYSQKRDCGGERVGREMAAFLWLGRLYGVAYVQPVTSRWHSVRRGYMCSIVWLK
jgi:hypothetical protein